VCCSKTSLGELGARKNRGRYTSDRAVLHEVLCGSTQGEIGAIAVRVGAMCLDRKRLKDTRYDARDEPAREAR